MKIYDCLEDICNLIKIYCFSIVITFIIFNYYELPYDMKIAFMFFAIVFITYLINSFIHNLPLFTLLHLLLFIPPFYIGMTDWGIVSCVIFLVILVIIDYRFWFFEHDQKTGSIPLGYLIVFVGIYLYSDHMKRLGLTNAAYYLGQFFVIFSLAEMYLDNMHFLPTEGNDALQKPKKSVLNSNNSYIIGILTAILAFNCIIHLSILEKLLSFLLTKIGNFFKYLLRMILQTDDTFDTLEQLPENPTAPLPKPGPSNIIADILSYLFMTAAICFILYICYKAITYIVQLIKEHFHRNFKASTSLDNDMYEVSEDLKVKKQHHKPIFKFNLDLRERIRRRYQQEIKHQIKYGYQNKDSYTPNERSTQLLTNKQADIQELTSCYNKARYSDQPITSKEWNHIK